MIKHYVSLSYQTDPETALSETVSEINDLLRSRELPQIKMTDHKEDVPCSKHEGATEDDIIDCYNGGGDCICYHETHTFVSFSLSDN